MIFIRLLLSRVLFFFFFNTTATTEIYTLSLHDALPISSAHLIEDDERAARGVVQNVRRLVHLDRKSTRLNSSHTVISYAVFCLKKKKIITTLSCWLRSELSAPRPCLPTGIHDKCQCIRQ